MVVVMMAGITLVVCLRGGTPKSASESGVKMLLPDKLRGMNGTPSAISEGERAILPKDTEIAKMVYQSPAGAPVSVQVVLSGGEKRSIHRPEICLPAQGWILESGGVVPVRLSNGRRLDVMRLTAKRTVTLNNGSRVKLENIFYYWFVGRGITTPYHLERILLTNLDMVFRNVNHRWAYVVVSAPVLMGLVPGGMDQGQTDGMLHDAVRELAPAIMKNP
jgi:hypothetical protein